MKKSFYLFLLYLDDGGALRKELLYEKSRTGVEKGCIGNYWVNYFLKTIPNIHHSYYSGVKLYTFFILAVLFLLPSICSALLEDSLFSLYFFRFRVSVQRSSRTICATSEYNSGTCSKNLSNGGFRGVGLGVFKIC